MMSTQAKVLGPADGRSGRLGAIGVRFMVGAEESGGGFALVEHPMPAARPRGVAPTGTRARTSTATWSRAAWAPCSATRSCTATPATWIFKPRGQWHTFWNAGDEPARLLEFVSPGGLRALLRGRSPMAGRPAGPRADRRDRRPLRAGARLRQHPDPARDLRAHPGAARRRRLIRHASGIPGGPTISMPCSAAARRRSLMSGGAVGAGGISAAGGGLAERAHEGLEAGRLGHQQEAGLLGADDERVRDVPRSVDERSGRSDDRRHRPRTSARPR